METTIVYWGYIGIMENEMETIILYRVILGFYCGYMGIIRNIFLVL